MNDCVHRQGNLNESINDEQIRNTIYRVDISNTAAASKPEIDCDSSR